MRVAVLAHSFPRFPGDTHGPFVKHLCESLARLGHEMHVLVPFDPEIRHDPDTPLRIHPFRYVWPESWHLFGYSRTLRRDVAVKKIAYLQSLPYTFFAERALRRLVKNQKIELVHAHWLLPNGYIAQRVHRATGVPYAITLHGSDIFMAERNGLFSSLARQTLADCAHVTSCSDDLRNRLLALDDSQDPHHRDKVLVIANGTEIQPKSDPGHGADLRRRLGIGEDRRLLAAVGRMVDKKGFRYLLDALPSLFAAHPEVDLVLGGGGDLLEEHQRQAEELGLADRIHFPGMLTHEQVLELIAAAEIFVMPSVRDRGGNIDGLPIVVLEAMAAARPLVATDLAGIPLAVEDGVTGLLVPEKNSTALGEAIGRLLADPTSRQAMGEAGRRKVEIELNWDAIAQRHDTLYRRALS